MGKTGEPGSMVADNWKSYVLFKKNHDKNAGLYFGPVFNPVYKNKC